MVVDHVQHDLDVGLVERLHHLAELAEFLSGFPRTAVEVVRGEERERRIAPVVAFLGIELEDWHELDHRYAQLLQVGDLLGHPCERSSFFGCNPGVGTRSESLDVQLVDDGVVLVMGSWLPAPVEAPLVG